MDHWCHANIRLDPVRGRFDVRMSCHSVGGRGGEFGFVDNHRATFHHPTHIFDDHADVGERIALHRDDVRKVARRDGTETSFHADHFGGNGSSLFSASSLVTPILTKHVTLRALFRPKPLYTASNPRTIPVAVDNSRCFFS